MDNVDALFLMILTPAAFAVRLWRIFWPLGCVFDEVYFGNFSNYYIKSQFYYDIHPPLGKILAAVVANMSEYDGSINFNDAPVYPIPDYVMLRITPAILSAMCGPLAYLAVRFCSFSHAAATTAAVLTIFDTSLGAEGRHILSDGILHFFSILHVAVLMHTISVPGRGSRWKMWHVINALSLGAACSCKNTAWGLMAMDAFCYCLNFLPVLKFGVVDYVFEVVFWGGQLAILQFFVYIVTFFAHFILLPYTGPGTGYLMDEMKQQLIQNDASSLWGRRIAGPGLLFRSIWITLDMHRGNMGIQEFHDSMSFPSQWPVLHGVMTYFWGADGKEIRCLGNVFSYYLALLGVVCIPLGFNKGKRFWSASMFFVGYCVCYFPFYLIPRVMYQYHYCIPLILGCMCFGVCLDLFCSKRQKATVAVLAISLTLFGFWLWSPFTYGTQIHDRHLSIWSKTWIDGDAAHQSRRASYHASKERAKQENA